jgi:mRNA-degrading endonuclease YafQ of YafQ-DinJ toxin-antitoxin module
MDILKWQVKIDDEAYKVLGSSALTDKDREVIHQWAKLVSDNGPEILKSAPQTWRDHELFDDWKGHRASNFSYRGRIIYKVKDQIVTVIVVRITAEHDYKRKKD